MMKEVSRRVSAIETQYAGYRFRSRTEARYAVFLDQAGIAWDYEREGFELASGRYLPDFWLPGWNAWLEVKGPAPTETELRLCEELGAETDAVVILCCGEPGKSSPLVYCTDVGNSCGTGWKTTLDFTTDDSGAVRLGSNGAREFRTPGFSPAPFIGGPGSATLFKHNLAILAARQARFEFGQTPRSKSRKGST